jgi:hypothetical protein
MIHKSNYLNLCFLVQIGLFTHFTQTNYYQSFKMFTSFNFGYSSSQSYNFILYYIYIYIYIFFFSQLICFSKVTSSNFINFMIFFLSMTSFFGRITSVYLMEVDEMIEWKRKWDFNERKKIRRL